VVPGGNILTGQTSVSEVATFFTGIEGARYEGAAAAKSLMSVMGVWAGHDARMTAGTLGVRRGNRAKRFASAGRT